MTKEAEPVATENELIILDAAWDRPPLRQEFYKQDYSLNFNLPSHDLSDREIDTLCEEMKRKRYLVEEWEAGFIGLSPLGGKVWEKARQVNWSQYAAGGTSGDHSDMQIVSGSSASGWAYLGAMVHTELLDLENVTVSTSRQDGGPAYWSQAGSHYQIDITNVRLGNSDPEDAHEEFERLRTWWTHVSDLKCDMR